MAAPVATDSVYGRILDGVRDTLALLSALTDPPEQPLGGSPESVPVVLREEFEFVKSLDSLPCLIVSPDDGLAESPEELLMGGSAIVAYGVRIALVYEKRREEQSLWWRLRLREQIRTALFSPRVLASVTGTNGVPGDQFDVRYEPSTSQPQGLAQEMRAISLRFVFVVSVPSFFAPTT